MVLVCQSVQQCDTTCLVNAELGMSPLTTSSPPHTAQPKGILTSLIYLSWLPDYGARPCPLYRRAAHVLFDHNIIFPSAVGDEHPTRFEPFGRLLPESAIQKTRTTPYHPQSDGLIERFNRALLSMLSTTVQDHPWDWEECLRKVCFAYNSSVHPGTGYMPFYLMFGHQARLPLDVAFGTAPQ